MRPPLCAQEATTDFRGKYKLNVRPGAKGGLAVSMPGYVDNGGGAKNVEMPKNKDLKKSKVMPETQEHNLALVAPRLLSGTVFSFNGVSKVALHGATVDVRQPPAAAGTSPSPSKSPKSPKPRKMSNPSPVKFPSPPPSPPEMRSRVSFDDEHAKARAEIQGMDKDAAREKMYLKQKARREAIQRAREERSERSAHAKDGPSSSKMARSASLKEVSGNRTRMDMQSTPTSSKLARATSLSELSVSDLVWSPSPRKSPRGRRKSKISEEPEDIPVTSLVTEDVATAGNPNFKLELLPGLYNITFSAPGHESQVEHIALGKKGQPKASTLDVTLLPRVCRFSGKVLASNETNDSSNSSKGLSGAKVLIFDDNGEEIKSLTSDEDGLFIISLPAGMYTRRVVLDGYETKFDHIEIADDLISDVHLEIIKYDLIGTIMSQNDASYLSGEAAKPLEDAIVTLRDQNGAVVATTTSNNKGGYSLTAPPGPYTREVTADGHNPLLDDPVQLASDEQRADATLLVRLYSLSGTVVDADGDVPIPVATVELLDDANTLIMSILSGQDGTYKFDLPDHNAAVHKAKFTLIDLIGARSKWGRTKALLKSKTGMKREHPWVRRVSMKGYVTNEASHIMKADTSETVRLVQAQHQITGKLSGVDGAPLAGARIELHDASGNLITSAVTDENGYYDMAAGHGTFSWSAKADGYVEMTKNLQVQGDQSADASLEPVSYKLTGVVTADENGSKLGGVAVEVRPNPKEGEPEPPIAQKAFSCTTNPDGSYAVSAVVPGRYLLAFSEEDHEPGELEITISEADVQADTKLTLKTYNIQGAITESETGEAIEYATVALMNRKGKKETEHTSTDENGHYTFEKMLPGEHKIQVTAEGMVMKKHTFTSAKEDMMPGAAADVQLEALHFGLSGCVKSDEDKSCPPIPGAICWLKKNGKIKQRVVCDEKGVYSFGQLPGGLYNVVAGTPGFIKMRAVVHLDKDVTPGGEADLTLPKPLPPEADIGAALAELITPLKSMFQHYCSAAIVGEDNPFQMAFFQLEAFMSDLKLPDGLSKTANPKVAELFDDVNGASKIPFKIDHKGEVTGALRPDPGKSPDRILTFDEFLDYQVRLGWICGQRGLLSVRAFPHTRRGLGYALKLYVEEILMPRAQRLEVDPDFEENLKKFKMPQAISKQATKTFEEINSGGTMITVDQWIKIIKKWRAIGHNMSIIKCRVLYVQYADDDRGKVPFYVKEILPADETLKKESSVDFEEEEDDDVMEAKLAAAQAAQAEANLAGFGPEEPVKAERDALASLEDIRKPRATDQEMSIAEFKAAICRLAYLLCKGKTIGDRLEAFASMHMK